ncbi:MAG TPA: hypothetical protein VGD14_09550 [bacterium]
MQELEINTPDNNKTEISAHGDKVIIRTIPDMTIRDYEIGAGLQYERPTSYKVELLIDKGKYFAVSINDVEKKQSDIAYVNKWAEDGSEQMKISIDTGILAAIPASAGTYNYGATAGKISGNVGLGAAAADGSAAIALSKSTIIDKIVECGQVLTEQDIPNTNRWFVIPAWAATRIKTSDLADASYSGDGTSMIRNGRIGKIDDTELYVSNNVLSTTEGAVKCFSLLFGHKSALTFASQLVENETIPNPNDFGKLMRGLQVYGYKVIKADAMGHLYAKAA